MFEVEMVLQKLTPNVAEVKVLNINNDKKMKKIVNIHWEQFSNFCYCNDKLT